MQSLYRFLLLLATIATGALSVHAGEQRSYRSLAAEFKRRDPIVEATKNFRLGEIYIFSAMGVGKYYPGLEDVRLAERLEKKYGARPLGGTSDAVEGKAHLDYIQAATKFASAYNLQTVRLLGEKRRN